jgi:phenylpropionate dioxygenase-like ring-hydroxylating dioxygenase large terminal subunit
MFLAHTTDLENNQAKSLDIFENKKNLINYNGQYKLGSNICPHQNSRIICGTQESLTCQYHGWSWNLNGTPLNAGHTKLCNDVNLHMKPVYEYKGLLFEDNIDLSFLSISFENLRLTEYRVDTVNANPKVSMDIFLDVDHIPVVHNGVYDLLGIEGEANVEWVYQDWGSVQKVSDKKENLIAVWIAIYPYTMIEWQAGSVFITQCFENNKIAVWKYQDITAHEEEYKINSDMWETAFSQDKTQAEQMVRFPSTIHLETAKKHYRKWLSENGLD